MEMLLLITIAYYEVILTIMLISHHQVPEADERYVVRLNIPEPTLMVQKFPDTVPFRDIIRQ